MGIAAPIFIVGPGRSGTTLLLNIVSVHPHLAWFSGWTNQFPRLPQLSLISRINDIRPLERAARNVRRWPRPAEAYRIWNHCFPGFSEADEDWTASDIDDRGAARFKDLIRKHLRWQGKNRFITKYTGWPRITFLRSVFPDAHFVNIERDPRAVVYSYVKLRWWGYRERPEGYEALTERERIDFYSARYLRQYRSRRTFVDDYYEMKYEDLARAPLDALRAMCAAVDLPFPDSFVDRIATFEIRSGTNDAWKKALSSDGQTHLIATLETPLFELNYV